MRLVLLVLMVVYWAVAPCVRADGAGSAEKPAGTGVIVHRDGYILTAHHVVVNARRITIVMLGEYRVPALMVGADSEHDLALLKVETVGLSEAPIGYAGAVTLDEEVLVAGFPFWIAGDLDRTWACVRCSSEGRMKGFSARCRGPVFTRHGEVIALVTTKFSHPSGVVSEGMGFAVPIS